jgi:hypothetical protein
VEVVAARREVVVAAPEAVLVGLDLEADDVVVAVARLRGTAGSAARLVPIL